MTAIYIWDLGASNFILLGSIHLAFTFFTNKFSSPNRSAISAMKSSHPNLTSETTLWKAWIGFNASHSVGAIFIGVINIYIIHAFTLTPSTHPFFFALNILVVGFYLWLAKRYWFSKPYLGILITFICFTVGTIILL